MDKLAASETMLSNNKLERSLTFRSQVNYYLWRVSAYVCVEGVGSSRNCCPSNSQGGNPLPGDAPLHKSTSSITAPWRPARKPSKVLRPPHLPASACSTLFNLSSSSFSGLNSGFWEGEPLQLSKTVPFDSGFVLRFKHWPPRVLSPSSNRWGFVSYTISTTVSKNSLCTQESHLQASYWYCPLFNLLGRSFLNSKWTLRKANNTNQNKLT